LHNPKFETIKARQHKIEPTNIIIHKIKHNEIEIGKIEWNKIKHKSVVTKIISNKEEARERTRAPANRHREWVNIPKETK